MATNYGSHICVKHWGISPMGDYYEILLELIFYRDLHHTYFINIKYSRTGNYINF